MDNWKGELANKWESAGKKRNYACWERNAEKCLTGAREERRGQVLTDTSKGRGSEEEEASVPGGKVPQKHSRERNSYFTAFRQVHHTDRAKDKMLEVDPYLGVWRFAQVWKRCLIFAMSYVTRRQALFKVLLESCVFFLNKEIKPFNSQYV